MTKVFEYESGINRVKVTVTQTEYGTTVHIESWHDLWWCPYCWRREVTVDVTVFVPNHDDCPETPEWYFTESYYKVKQLIQVLTNEEFAKEVMRYV